MEDLVLAGESWIENPIFDLRPDDVAALGTLDRKLLLRALLDLLGDDASVSTPRRGTVALPTSGPLIVPGTKVFISLSRFSRSFVRDFVSILVLVSLGSVNSVKEGIALGSASAINIFLENASKLTDFELSAIRKAADKARRGEAMAADDARLEFGLDTFAKLVAEGMLVVADGKVNVRF